MAEGEREPGQAGPITIDELAALNDEIAALVRAGVPLDRGLLQAGSELPGGLKRITQALGERLSRGETLTEALEAESQSTPPLYRAVVEAGRSRDGCRPLWRGWRGTCAATPRPGRRSAWPSGTRSSC